MYFKKHATNTKEKQGHMLSKLENAEQIRLKEVTVRFCAFSWRVSYCCRYNLS
jgi:hypothetical protein